MKKLFFLLVMILALATAAQAKDDDLIYLFGRVKEATHKLDLTNARVRLLDADGAVKDSTISNRGRRFVGHQLDTISEFYLRAPRIEATYTIEVECEGYQPEYLKYTLDNIGKREHNRDIPVIYMRRAPKVLNEVVVKTSKIKFYHKGDTLVYSADAFQLAEGSMLDALIAQLPGVELNTNGQIKVNGEFVESLLLNGKEFMDGNKSAMLENIAAYTVKDVQVYESQTPEAKRKQDLSAPKVLTMDVKLKKEYQMGWIVNAQGGYGTEDRYLGRLFASWFNATTRVSLIGNVNNLNDNRSPGKNDTWTPEMLPNGTKQNSIGSIDYNYENPESTREARGGFGVASSINNVRQTTSRINFLPGADTYDNSFSSNHDNELNLYTRHSINLQKNNFLFDAGIRGNYSRSKNVGSAIAGAFSEDKEITSADMLEAIFNSTNPGDFSNVLNMSSTYTDGWRRSISGSFSPYISYKIPKSTDAIYAQFNVSYQTDKEHDWKDYAIKYGLNPNDPTVKRQYTDVSPNHNLSLGSRIGYRTSINQSYLSISYEFSFKDEVKDSYMYALDRLNDMGIFGIVPEDYLQALDVANSYTSRLLTGTHSISPQLNGSFNLSETSALMLYITPQLNFVHRHLNYWRNDHSYRLSKSDVTLRVASIFSGMVQLNFNGTGEGRRKNYRNTVRYSFRVDPTLPQMTDMLDIVDDSNPLNIYYGNPDLKTAMQFRHLFRWSYNPASYTLNNILYASYNHTSNALTRGYTYDTTTGVRYNRMYNVDGNHSVAFTNELSWQFGATKQFSLSSETDFNLSRLTDMIGVNLNKPALEKVNNRVMSEKLKLGWQVAGQSLQLRCDFTQRHTTSTETGFNSINATHWVYGLSGVFKLPQGFGISTDFLCYTRRGYGESYLDTTDPVWNVRATYSHPKHTRWVFIADGFDLLHKLSNVNYAVTSTGRTVSYTNTIPRYFLFSVQYRFNIQPKKR